MAGVCMLGGKDTGVKSQSACNAGGGTWIPDAASAEPKWSDKSLASKAGDALLYGSMIYPGTWAARGAYGLGKAGLAGIKNADKLKKLMGFGGKTGEKLKKVFPGAQGVKGHQAYTKPSYLWTKPNTKSSYPINPNSPRMRQFSPMRATATGLGVGQLGAGAYGSGMVPGTDPRAQKLENQRKLQIEKMMAAQTLESAQAKKVSDAKAETERVAGLGFWERMGEDGFWDKTFSSNPNDTRLQRLTDLVGDMSMSKKDYEKAKLAGQTSSQRWRDSEEYQAGLISDMQIANTAASAKSKYGKMTPTNLALSVAELVKERFDSAIPMMGAGDDELKALNMLVAKAIIAISNDPNNAGMGEAEAVEMAIDYVEENYT